MDKIRAFTYTHKLGLCNQLVSEGIIVSEGNRITVDALWDTGASCTAISKEVVEKLSLVSTGKTTIKTPTDIRVVDTYLVDIQLPNDLIVKDVVVCGTDIGNQGIGVLIGMNIINLGDFCVSSYGGTTAFSFRVPSQQQTDYVKQILVQNKIGQKHGQGKRKKRK